MIKDNTETLKNHICYIKLTISNLIFNFMFCRNAIKKNFKLKDDVYGSNVKIKLFMRLDTYKC